MYYNILFYKNRVVIQPLMDISSVEVTFLSCLVKWRHFNFAFTHTEHHSPPRIALLDSRQTQIQRQNPEVAEGFFRAGICISKLIR